MGSFFLFHRHRVYNPREEVWMGWERKRGKLMDLNRLLRQQYDSFPVKIGDLSILSRVRFVITLDSDTELPRGSAHRMVGTLGASSKSGDHRSGKEYRRRRLWHLAATGWGKRSKYCSLAAWPASIREKPDSISTREQFLTCIRICTAKPSSRERESTKLTPYVRSLIAGSRATPCSVTTSSREPTREQGLASDIEVIEDYPSHYSAYNRRKHRWLRGDWQIAGWLLPTVPDESGQRVPNPISIAAQWKILDNLRRSLVEPATLTSVCAWAGWCCRERRRCGRLRRLPF